MNKTLSESKALVEALKPLVADAEAEVNDRVYRLFKLTDDEIKPLQKEIEH